MFGGKGRRGVGVMGQSSAYFQRIEGATGGRLCLGISIR